jgi:hypothetical protein
LREPGGAPHVRAFTFFGGGYGVSSLAGGAGDRVRLLTSEWRVATDRTAEGATTLALVHRPAHAPRLAASLAGATDVSVRAGGQTLTVADDRGRVIVVDLLEGLVLRDLRIG